MDAPLLLAQHSTCSAELSKAAQVEIRSKTGARISINRNTMAWERKRTLPQIVAKAPSEGGPLLTWPIVDLGDGVEACTIPDIQAWREEDLD